MTVYPVIMCGGSGTRLWPASRPHRPKQFIPLIGARSSFQETVLRVQGLSDGGRPIVVAGVAHRQLLAEQLAEIGVDATIILEPEARDSAAAIAAAAAWIEQGEPDAVAVIVSADHHIPDPAAFRAAIEVMLPAARDGGIVTLGIRPTAPSPAYGYIQPVVAGAGVKPVAAFVEKPDAVTAQRYVDDGYLWNSGNFVASARTLMAELVSFAPQVAAAARAGIAGAIRDPGAPDVLTLGEAFRAAPKISIDYAVMEKTAHAAVLPVAFDWTDLGAWDAVWAASPKDARGVALPVGSHAVDSSDVLIVAPRGVHVAVIGAHRLAVVVQKDAVLVCHLDQSQSVKAAAAAAPTGDPAPFATLAEAARWYEHWLKTAALPLWATLGRDLVSGGFREGLTLDGASFDPYLRLRVQNRQVYVYASVAARGYAGPWLETARRGFDFINEHGRGADGRVVNVLGQDGAVLDDTPMLYEQAFALLAMSAMQQAAPDGVALVERARTLREGLSVMRHAAGGYREAGDRPFQANAHMHLLEASLAWEEAGGDAGWAAHADEIAELALTRFIDPASGMLQEFFNADWTALSDERGLIEPGHQFEWAWLMARWAEKRGREDARLAARRLYEVGKRGVDPGRQVAVNALWPDMSLRDAAARLWPQTEYLKAALILGEDDDALMAAQALARYLDVPTRGAWRDLMLPDGRFREEHAPASSLYHLMVAIFSLAAQAR